MSPPSLVAYKRWKLRPGAALDAVIALVADRIVPPYAALTGDVRLGLEVLAYGRTVLAVQRWTSRSARDAAMTGLVFDSWWAAYQPALAEWDALVEFVDEWETEVVL